MSQKAAAEKACSSENSAAFMELVSALERLIPEC
jgi:hypothetical protein